ncbi:MAG: branched-chain amino acid ABC transporter permease [Anaerolineae bacterium]|nr:branched-chain amino acid ABC transporter permease [Anaerolineae bacterium]
MWKRYRSALVSVGIILALVVLAYAGLGATKAASVLLSGLTLAALYFLMAAGLSLIFGLMDVLNFAHGVLFMVGAYIGYSTFGNPRLLLNTLPLVLTLVAGVMVGTWVARPLHTWEQGLRRRVAAGEAGSGGRQIAANVFARLTPSLALAVLGIAVAVWAARGFPISSLVAFETTATGGAISTAVAQEALAPMLGRLVRLALAGLLLGPVFIRGDDESQCRGAAWRRIAAVAALVAAGAVLLLARDPLEGFMMGLSIDIRFALALLAGAITGALLGGLIESVLVRPFYGNVVTQIVLTLGLSFVGVELVEAVWGPEGRPPMAVPSFFAESCRSPNLFAWFTESCSSIDVLGRAFPTYRLFIIAVGVVILVAVGVLLRYSRLGMIIRAGVQDREMVEALGINVRRVFTLVFALGSALAALGGVVAAPFIGVYPEMGGIFQLQGFIAVVIGGMGSYLGTAVGSLLIGLARAFGDALVTAGITFPWAEQPFMASPALARASTVLIMAVVLLVRPAGIFGKKE